MGCVPISESLFRGLLLLIFSQGSWSRSQASPSERCTSCVEISCMVINMEYVDCNWTRSEMHDVNYNFSSAFNKDPHQECPHYLQQRGHNVGCRIPLQNKSQFDSLKANLSIDGNQTVFIEYKELKNRVKLNPPHNLTVVWSANGQLCLHWMDSYSNPRCLQFRVRYQRGLDQWQVYFTPEFHYCIPFMSKEVNVTFQVSSKTGMQCGKSDYWSDWSDPVHWGNYTGSVSSPLSQSWWQVWVSVLGVVVLIALTVLLCYCERIRVLLVVPDPSKNLQDLFQKHNGNVESWVYISRELKEAFEPDYTESPCVVCEPSPTLKTKGCSEPVQQPSS